MDFPAWILTLAIISGQLIKIPVVGGQISILDITVLAFCLLGFWRLKFKLEKPPLFVKVVLVFALLALLSLILTPLHLSPQEYLTAFFYTVRLSVYIFFGFLLFTKVIPALSNNLLKIMIFSGVGLSILGLIQFIFLSDLRFLTKYGWDPHYLRTVSTFLDPNFAGAFFVLTLIIFLSLRGALATRQSISLFILAYLALLTTFSRSSYLMFLTSGLVLSFLQRSKIFALVTLTLFAVLLLGFQIYSSFVAIPRNIDRTESATFRLNTWQQGLTIFQSYPILGIGFNAYRYAIREFNLGDEQFLKSHGSSSNDSSLLFVAATTGILGLLAYLCFLGSLIWKTKNYLLTAALFGLIIHSIFANSLFFPPILLWLILNASIPKK